MTAAWTASRKIARMGAAVLQCSRFRPVTSNWRAAPMIMCVAGNSGAVGWVRSFKTGEREVDCRYDPAILATFRRLKRRSIQTGKRDFVFTDEEGDPLSQERRHKKIWLPTLRKIELRTRGQYNIRDTFISLALSAGEDPAGSRRCAALPSG